MLDLDVHARAELSQGFRVNQVVTPALTPHETDGKYAGSSLRAKYAVDFTLAICGLLVLWPLLILLTAALWILQGRPIFIGHRRIGKDGVLFSCYKFRTMVRDADSALERHLARNPAARAEWEQTRKLKDDPRITPLGAVLRSSSIDEIPQLFNIMKGEMSVVGPRPITVGEAEMYGARMHDYMSVRPGLTGLWQISGRNDVSYAERVELDARYVAEQSLWGDFMIMAKTVPSVLLRQGSY